MEVSFFAAGLPKGQPRPRAFARNGRARVFDPGTAEGWKSSIALAAREVVNGTKFDGPLAVSLHFQFPRPRTHFTKKGLRPEAPSFHTAKPDCDNLAKAVLDALTTLGVWGDDSYVARLHVCKKYSEQPGADVSIRTLEGGE